MTARVFFAIGVVAFSPFFFASSACKWFSGVETATSASVSASSSASSKKPDGVDVELNETQVKNAGVRTGKPHRVQRTQEVVASGLIEFAPSRVAKVGPLVEGRVIKIHVEPGQYVKQGALLATLQCPEVGKARADVLSEKIKLAQAQTEFERQTVLSQGQLTTQHALNKAKSDVALAQQSLRAATERLWSLGAEAPSFASQEASRVSSIVALIAPTEGTVLELHARLGQSVSSSDTLFVVGRTDLVWLSMDVFERDLAKVQLGYQARVTTTAFAEQVFEGRIDSMGTVLDAVRRVLPVRIVLANRDGKLRPGMTATARILPIFSDEKPTLSDAGLPDSSPDVRSKVLTDARTDSPLHAVVDAATEPRMFVPRSAIQTIDGAAFVFVEKGKGQYEMRSVERGEQVEQEVEIVRGLEDNEVIVIKGAFILKSEFLKELMGKND